MSLKHSTAEVPLDSREPNFLAQLAMTLFGYWRT